MICVCLGSVGCLRFVCRYSLLILREAKNRELKKQQTKPGYSLSVWGFPLACVCSNAVRSSSSLQDIYFSISQAAVRLSTTCSPPSPSCVPAFAHAGHRHFPTCASHPGSIRATVWLSYCTSLLCQHPALASTKKKKKNKPVCTIWFFNQSQAGWNLERSLLPLPQIPWKGNSGHSALAQSPPAGHFTPSAPSLFYFTVCGERKNCCAERERKKNEAQISGTF